MRAFKKKKTTTMVFGKFYYFANIFLKKQIALFFNYTLINNHTIDLKNNSKLPKNFIYS